MITLHDPNATAICGVAARWMRACVLAGAALSASAWAQEPDVPPMVDPCETPLRVVLTGVPSPDALPLETEVDTCGRRDDAPLNVDSAQSDVELTTEIYERLPKLTLALREGKLDVRLRLLHTAAPIVCEAQHLAPVSSTVPLSCKPAAAAPTVRMSIEPLREYNYLSLHATNTTAREVLAELGRVEKIELRHVERLSDEKLSFYFDLIPLRAALGMVASTSEKVMRADGPNAFVFGTSKNEAAIDALRLEADGLRERDDSAGLKTTLQRIVALGKPVDADDLHNDVGGELAELGEIAITDDDLAHAETLARARVNEATRSWGGTESRDHALASIALARVQWLRQGKQSALPTLREALLQIQRFPSGGGIPEDLVVIAALVDRLRTEGDLDQALALARHACDLYDAANHDWNANRAAVARLTTEAMLVELGLALEAHGDDAAAVSLFERAIAQILEIHGDSSTAAFLREMLIHIARRTGDSERLAKYERLQAELAKTEKGKARYAITRSQLSVALARKADYSGAIDAWETMVAFRLQRFGADSEEYRNALRDLAVLHAMAGDAARAREIDAKAGVEPAVTRAGASTPEAETPMDPTRFGLAIELASDFRQRLETSGASAADPTLMRVREWPIQHYIDDGLLLVAALETETLWSVQFRAKGAADAETIRLARRTIELYERAGKPDGGARVRDQMPKL